MGTKQPHADYSSGLYGPPAPRTGDPSRANVVPREWQTAEHGRRNAIPRPATFDEAAMTVLATVASETPVVRRDARGPYLEILPMSALDLKRAADVPVVDNHRVGSARDVLGIVEDLWIEGATAVARLRFSTADDAAPVVARVRDGTLTGLSVGYRVAAWAESQDASGARVKRATAWTIVEVSLTPQPADPAARIRSTANGGTMTTETETTDPAAEDLRRRSEIRALTRAAGLGADVADSLIDQGADLAGAKAALFDAMQKRARTAPVIRAHTAANDDPAVIVRRTADALHHRATGAALPEDARPFAALSMLDVARESLARAGVSHRGMSADEVFHRAAHSTSDFPLVVSNLAGKVALDAYQAAQSPLKTLARQRILPNFKPSTSIRLGEIGRLEPLAEGGEITHTTRAENGESLHLRTYARGLNVTRELLVNDDLGLFGDMFTAFGTAAAQTEADVMVSLLTAPGTLSDGTAVFHASRGNLASGPAAIGEAAVAAARQAMRGFKGLDGKTLVNVVPRYLLVGPELETEAEKFLASIYPATTEDANPFAGRLTLLVEPRIEDDRWFIFADPARLPAMQYAYLAGAQGVQIQRMEAWDSLGMRFRAWLDFGAGWLDWRGAYAVPAA